MKHYLDLVPISAKIHKKQSRMSIFCIVLAVFLVTTIFGMADMFIRSQILQAQQESGNWHIAIKNISNAWTPPLPEVAVILLIVVSSVILAVHGPIKRIRNMSIVDTISAQ